MLSHNGRLLSVYYPRISERGRVRPHAPDRAKNGALLMGLPLVNARSWLARRAGDINEVTRAKPLQGLDDEVGGEQAATRPA
jgi:hypothetical protein